MGRVAPPGTPGYPYTTLPPGLGGGGGGQTPRQKQLSNTTAGGVPLVLSNGGVSARNLLFVFPVINLNSGPASFAAFDPSAGFNDPQDGSFYAFRVEDIATANYPTVRRVFMVYRDLGQATITLQLTAVDDNGQVNSNSQTFTIGTTSATGRLCGKFFDLALTGYEPQLAISRAPGAGPVSISRVMLIGETEDTTH